MSDWPRISLLIPAYNEENVIQNTLDQLVNEVEYPDKEILLYLDGCTDGTYDKARAFGESVIIYQQPERRGVIAAMNFLIGQASGDILIKQDADMLFSNPGNCLYNIARHFQDAQVGGVLFVGEQDFEDSIFQYLPEKHVEAMKKEKHKSFIARGEDFVCKLVNNLRKEKLFPLEGIPDFPVDVRAFRAGLLDPIDECLTHDDLEIGFQLLEKGYKVLFVDDAFTYCPGGYPYSTKDLLSHKIKSHTGWRTSTSRHNIKFLKYNLRILLHFLQNIHRFKVVDVVAFFWWCIVYSWASIVALGSPVGKPTETWRRFERRY